MNDEKTLIAALREAIEDYRSVLAGKPEDEEYDFLSIAGQAEMIATSIELGEIERAKLCIYAFSRQVSDSYYSQPPEFRALSAAVTHIKKCIL